MSMTFNVTESDNWFKDAVDEILEDGSQAALTTARRMIEEVRMTWPFYEEYVMKIERKYVKNS